MIDMTMSVFRAKKVGDLVAIVACPEEGHTVDLKVVNKFFLIDCADLARKTFDGMLAFADSTQDFLGCMGHTECIITMDQAIESCDLPEEVFCFRHKQTPDLA